MVLKFYTSLTKGLKLSVIEFCGLIPTFVEVTEKNLIGGAFLLPILNRVKEKTLQCNFYGVQNAFCKTKDLERSDFERSNVI